MNEHNTLTVRLLERAIKVPVETQTALFNTSVSN